MNKPKSKGGLGRGLSALIPQVMSGTQNEETEKEKGEINYMEETEEEQDDSRVNEITAALNLTENMSVALDCRMSGMSYPEIARRLSRAVSTVYEYFEKMRARYTAIYG